VTVTGNEDFLAASLHHGNLQVDTSDPNPRPMIAILDARPGLAGAFRERIVELVRQVRREPGCTTFTAYEACTPAPAAPGAVTPTIRGPFAVGTEPPVTPGRGAAGPDLHHRRARVNSAQITMIRRQPLTWLAASLDLSRRLARSRRSGVTLETT
jgi:hypothetical protein